jgi:crotonyl-CoA reductase
MQEILDAIESGAAADDFANLSLPESTRAAHVLRSETEMWEGVDSWDKDPRKSLHVGDVPLPELAPDEAVIAVMASSINFNTVWTSIFEPLSTFGFLDRQGVGLGCPSRPGLPRGRLRRLGRGAARRLRGAQLEAG